MQLLLQLYQQQLQQLLQMCQQLQRKLLVHMQSYPAKAAAPPQYTVTPC